MEDQGVLSHETFLVKNFPFFNRRANQKTIGALSSFQCFLRSAKKCGQNELRKFKFKLN